jgi:ribulose 1,5-bisphosphate synthetase/thiazole synthase
MDKRMKTRTVRYEKEFTVRDTFDIVVAGGGIAGVCAACAAAESGASVALVEQFAITGGMMTAGGVNAFCGETAGQGRVFDEIIHALEEFDAVAPYRPYDYQHGDNRTFDKEILAVILQELLLRKGVRLFLHTRFVDAIRRQDGNRIDALLIRGQSGPEAIAASHFVDCTGEGEVAALAGCKTMKGRDGDGLQLPMSMMYFVREVPVDQAVCQVPDGWFERISSAESLPMVSIWPNGRPGSNAIKVKTIGFDSTDTDSMTGAEIAARRKMMQVLDYHQRIEKRPWLLDHVSAIIGIREGRRIVGEYVMTENDVRQGRRFDDGVAVGTYYIDAHDPTTEKRVAQIIDPEKRRVPPYEIPLRSLIAGGMQNLWMAGRNASAELMAMSSMRVSTSCAMMGQAAGIGAAIAAKMGCAAAEVPAKTVRATVLERGANLELGGRPTSNRGKSQ